MIRRRGYFILALFLLLVTSASMAQRAKHTYTLGTSEILKDDEPYQIISGEMHPARIPVEYWRHRIRMAKAMGCKDSYSIFISVPPRL